MPLNECKLSLRHELLHHARRWLLILSTLGFVFLLFERRTEWLQDFHHYYYAAFVYSSGGDPYDLVAVQAVAPVPLPFHLVYPPISFLLYLPFSKIDMPSAAALFLALKLVAAACLGLITWTCLRRTRSSCTTLQPISEANLLLTIFLLGYSGALLIDLQAGNPAMFEALFVWAGIYMLAFQRPWAGSALLLSAALVKGPLAVLLPIFWLTYRGPGRQLLPISFVLLALLHLSSMHVWPDLWEGFQRNLPRIDEDTFHDSALRRIVSVFLPFLGAWSSTVYIFAAATLAGATGYRVRDLMRAKSVAAPRFISGALLLLLCYALLVPRMKDYSYVLLLPVVSVTLSAAGSRPAAILLLTAAIFPYFALEQVWPGGGALLAVCWPYLLTLTLWCLVRIPTTQRH